jgi:AraC-like DNA-binding protein
LEVHPAVRFALHRFHATPGGNTISAVTDAIGLSPRRFVQVFREQVGLNPKLYCRVRRFRQVLGAIGAGGPVEWAEIALDSGYFDQAHFIHDFRAFSGINPSAYVASQTIGSHVALS